MPVKTQTPEAAEAPEEVAEVAAPEPQTPEAADGYRKVVSPFGHTTLVPDSIVDTLVNSGYTVE